MLQTSAKFDVDLEPGGLLILTGLGLTCKVCGLRG
jgi:hypothetical protein